MQTAGVWPRLVDAASWAPSPHNTQPWLVHPRSDTVAELYVPLLERRVRRRAGGEDGEVWGHVLAGRDAARRRVGAAAPEAPGK